MGYQDVITQCHRDRRSFFFREVRGRDGDDRWYGVREGYLNFCLRVIGSDGGFVALWLVGFGIKICRSGRKGNASMIASSEFGKTVESHDLSTVEDY